MNKFEKWWDEEGSKPPQGNYDWEEYCKKMCAIAWADGAYVECEECAKVAENIRSYDRDDPEVSIAQAIRNRNEQR